MVEALLDQNRTHRELRQLLRQIVLKKAEKLPPIKVLCNTSYGGYDYNEAFTTFVRSRTNITAIYLRSDPALIQAISEYGRFICDKNPFIIDDMRIVCNGR